MTKFFLKVAIFYSLFVIYGSLVPFDFHKIPLPEEALSRFKNIPYLDLGMESRADWIANILLYIPLAFLWLAAFQNIRNAFVRGLVNLLVPAFCLVLAVSIEFSQLFFPPRTVSVNDLLAETIGTVIGIAFWHVYGRDFLKLCRQLSLGGLLSVKAAILFYILIYLALGFFPFDFITSFQELEFKLASDNAQLFLSADVCRQDITRCLVKLAVEALALTPLGFLTCLLPYISHRLTVTLLLGFFLGIFSEAVQLLLVSGVAEGISVLTRMLGMSLGYFLFKWISKRKLSSLIRWLRPMVLCAAVPYLFIALSVNGWLKGNWLTVNQAMEKLADTQFLPFYYFYYTTETTALISLLNNMGTYIPIGMAYWGWFYSQSGRKKASWIVVGLSAVVVAIILEIGKLFLADKHADPTDILIAFAAASGAYVFLNRLVRLLNHDPSNETGHEQRTLVREAASNARHHSSVFPQSLSAPPDFLSKDEIAQNARWLSGLLVVIIVWALVRYPTGAYWLAGFLAGYGYLLFRLPQAWLFAVPALLPVMDFTPWTGRFFFDEFDLVILTTLAAYFWQPHRQTQIRLFSKSTFILLWIFGFFYFISLLKGLLPFTALDANSFTNYYSNYNGLRVGKGVLWGALLIPLLKQANQYHYSAASYFGAGILAGLTGVLLFSFVERWVFPGLFDFSFDYRIQALFSSMHTGGGHIESYLSLTLPFIALLFLNSSHSFLLGGYGIGLFIAGLYALLVTFSRGGYIGFAISFLVLIIALAFGYKGKSPVNRRSFGVVFLLAGIILLIAVPVFQGTYIQYRFRLFNQDSEIRSSHWLDAVAMMDNDWATALWGMGIGSYPRTYFWLNSENVIPATYQIGSENGNPYLRLRGGDALYFGQYITVFPQTHYRLSIDLRGQGNGLALTIPVCEKSLQYSFRCSSTVLTIKAQPANGWQHVEQMIDTGTMELKAGNLAENLLKRPIQIALYNANGPGKIVDIDNIGLFDSLDNNVIANGDFSRSTDFWFFSTEKHHPWHILNLWVQILFDQGWLGVIGFVSLLVCAIYHLFKELRTDPHCAIFLASCSGFLVVGVVDSPFDAPRLTLLFVLILFFSLTGVRKKV